MADTGIHQLQAAQGEQAEKADFFCKGFRNPAVQEGTEQQRKTQAEAADAIDGGNFSPGERYPVGAVCGAGHKGIQAQCKNEN